MAFQMAVAMASKKATETAKKQGIKDGLLVA
jgi:hypothetical protein